MTFAEMLKEAQKKQESLVCVGLDTELGKIPTHLLEANQVFLSQLTAASYFEEGNISPAIFDFNKAIIDATAQFVCAYKPNFAFYGAYGNAGLLALHRTINYIHDTYPGILVILDVKRGDIGNTAKMYAEEVFSRLFEADAATFNPYMGLDTLEPYFEKGKGVIVLCKTSNPRSGDFQDLMIDDNGVQRPLYHRVARMVAEKWGDTGNAGLVVGATYPTQLSEVRSLVGLDIPILIPGVGKQGGKVPDVITSNQGGLAIINAGGSVIYASSGKDFAEKAGEAAKNLRDEIREAQKACSS